MSGTGARRPVGWWLKEADRRLDAAVDVATGGPDVVGRRGWQVLSSLATRRQGLDALTAALVAFDTAGGVERVVGDLRTRGHVVDSGGSLRLTPLGERLLTDLAPRVDEVRQRVAEALPGEDYPMLLRLLEQLVGALDEPGADDRLR